MNDEDLIPISALQHYLYCPRQCALIHIERLWAESRHTAEGRLLHEKADTSYAERRRGVRTVGAMPLLSLSLGLTGVADIVEFHRNDQGEYAFPVEYKRGRPKAHRADEVQLCAQGLCLEQMLGTPLNGGALFYGESRRRKEVVFDHTLRSLTLSIIASTRQMIASGQTPMATYDSKRCAHCSLLDLCQPQWLSKGHDVNHWLKMQLDT